MNEDDALRGKSVLVVEDDFVLAREMCEDLRDHGVQVIGPAPTVHYARLVMGKRRLDGAVLDIKLFGEEVYGLIDTLLEQDVPIILATAYEPEKIRKPYRFLDTLQKPVSMRDLRGRIAGFGTLPPRPAAPAPQKDENAPADRWSRALARAMALRDSPVG